MGHRIPIRRSADGETVKPLRCTDSGMLGFPCGCLDFIPAENYFRFRTPQNSS